MVNFADFRSEGWLSFPEDGVAILHSDPPACDASDMERCEVPENAERCEECTAKWNYDAFMFSRGRPLPPRAYE